MVAERACVRMGVSFWPGMTRTIGSLPALALAFPFLFADDDEQRLRD